MFKKSAAPSGGYNLTKSLRFRSSASAYLSRTPASASNRKTWTWSGWVKLGTIASDTTFFAARTASGGTYLTIGTSSLSDFRIQSNNETSYPFLKTNALFRDPSAWYHFVVAIDTTQSTSTNRAKVWVNGTAQTFASYNVPAQNTDLAVNSTETHLFGQQASGSYFDGYMAEVNFIDGQALTPSSFGQTSATTGVWIPKKYTGTYGTNGFYLPFTDVATTSGSNAGLGKDFSGNGNYWTTNNISVTSGATYDSMTDVPTNTNATTANYAVWNPITTGTATVTNGNLTSTGAASTGNLSSILIPTSGKWYAEFTWSGSGAGTPDIGIFSADVVITASSARCEYRSDGSKVVDATVTGGYGATYTNGDVISVAVDVDSNTVTFYKNNASQGAITYTSSNGRYGFNVIAPNSSWILNANFGQRPFAYTPPTGFKALNTFNLPTPTIGATASTQANKYMDISLYTGTGSSQSITGLNFQPDWTWIKGRSGATDHGLYDAVRGVQKQLESNTTTAETTETTGLTAFNSNGFTVGALAQLNTSSATYVAWNWKANGSGSSNTQGTITSTVSANTSAGFSVVTYSGASTTSTVGHGLGVAPSMVIVKSRNTSGQDWQVYHSALGQNQIIQLNSTAAAQTYSNYWYNGMTSSVFGVNNYSGVNASGTNYVAYCFAQVAGYSAFGSYTGNGSSDGPFIYTGFRPRWLFVKKSSGTSYWQCLDTARSSYNVAGEDLIFDLSDAEKTTAQGFNNADILSNGFKIRNTNCNDSGGTYIFGAFAESPFKFSNAR